MLAVGSAFDSLPLIHYAALNLLSSLKRGGAIDVKDDNANFSRRRSIGLIQSNLPLFYRHFFYPFLLLQLLSFTLGHKQVVTRTDSRVAIGLTDERERGGEREDDKMSFGDRWLPLGVNEIPGKGNDATLVEGKEIRLLLAFGFLLALVSFVAIGNCSTNRLISGKSLGNCQFNKNKC